jgi:glutamate 5-kinase
VKVGTAVVARGDGRIALGRLGSLVESLCALRDEGREVVLVSSGAVGLGAERLGFDKKPTPIVDRQACAAAGQGLLMGIYTQLFERLGRTCAQVLLTEDDFSHRRRFLNLASTLDRLLELGCTPIINENDTVSTAELAISGGAVFGDNDRLSALVASAIQADLLVLLTDVDGVYTAPPGEPGATRIPVFLEGTEVAIGAASKLGRGGMAAKIAAARVGTTSGVNVVIANGSGLDNALRAARGEDIGTWFPAQEDALNRRRRWMAYATYPQGRLVVNDGARDALVQRNASLLAPGITAVEGDFAVGSVVSIVDAAGEEIARGRVDLDAAAVREKVASGARGRAIIHRDHVVILEEEA